jgi:undecaprenyl-diphosphatase
MIKLPATLQEGKSLKQKAILLALVSLLFWVPVVVFSKIAGEVLEKEPVGLDMTILSWIHAQASATYDYIFLFITTMANVEIIGPLTVLIVAWLVYKKRRQDALVVFSSFTGAAAANVVLKFLFHRDRPAFWHSLIHETGYSFPSGHAMLSSALILSIILITWHTKARWFVTVGGLILILLVGISRLYMGVHYPTDIIAGWAASFVWVLIVFVIVTQFSYKRRNIEQVTQ